VLTYVLSARVERRFHQGQLCVRHSLGERRWPGLAPDTGVRGVAWGVADNKLPPLVLGRPPAQAGWWLRRWTV
jgi:hypothetical protein